MACLISVLIYVSAVLICVEDGLGTPVSIGAASGAVQYTVYDAHCKEIIILKPGIVQSCCVVECALSPVARLYCIQRSWLEQMKRMPAIDTPQLFCKGVFVYVCTSCTTCVMLYTSMAGSLLGGIIDRT